jgi:hypothetical protein
MLPGNIDWYWQSRTENRVGCFIRERSDALLAERSAESESVGALASILDAYSTAVPEFGTFSKMLFEYLNEIGRAHSEWFSEVIRWLPVDVPQGGMDGGLSKVLEPLRPNPVEREKLSALTKTLLRLCDDVTGFIHDIGIESQNLLIGGLFDVRRPSRVPLDPTVPVLSSDRSVIERYETFLKFKVQRRREKSEFA